MNTFTIDTIDNDAGDTDNVDDDANMMEILVKSWHLFYHNVSSTTNRAKVAKFDKRKVRSKPDWIERDLPPMYKEFKHYCS